MSIKTKVAALTTSIALVGTLGLTACSDSTSATEADATTSTSTSEVVEAADASAPAASAAEDGPITTAAEDLFSTWSAGIDEKGEVIYFYSDDESDASAMLIIYDLAHDTFVSYAGKLEKAADGKATINTEGAFDSVSFTVSEGKEEGTQTLAFENGATVSVSAVLDDDVRELLAALDAFATDLENSGIETEAEVEAK